MNKETQTLYSEYDEELEAQYKAAMKKYWLQCLLMEGSKIILFFIIFGYFHVTAQYITALFVLMMVRCNGGGLHCKHYISCFLLSLFILASCIYCGTHLHLSKFITISTLIICSALGYLIGPIVSSNRPEPDAQLIRQSKLRTAGIIFIYCFLICICPYNQYLNIGTWTIIIHILQLLLAKFLQRRRVYV